MKIMAADSYEKRIKVLERKKRIAEMKLKERKLKVEIFKLYFPFKFNIKFNKIIVVLSIFSIISYVISAIFLQKYTSMELSPTLTTCVFAFFGTELLSLAGIKLMDTKCGNNDVEYLNTQYDDTVV